ncbi:hypothetical protein B0H19DRAFT_470856 [Mycena capillaripes]|nr:hypothetical protein B0H19DRAFT_470856 [Mycena capillaripes]
MPHLRFASLAIDHQAEELTIEDILNCFNFPGIQGLNLKLMKNHPPEVLSPVPAQLKNLKILRLCGELEISNASLLDILTELETLADLAVELRGVEAVYLFTLLTPTKELILASQLRALRVTEFEYVNVDKTADALLAMLPQRFGGKQVTPLQRFELSLPAQQSSASSGDSSSATSDRHSAMLDSLKLLGMQEEWDIRVLEGQWDFWKEDMDGEFL